MPIHKEVRVRIDWSKVPHQDYVAFVAGIHASLASNPHFPNPPVDLDFVKAKLDKYRTLVAAAADRSKTVISQRNSVRQQLDALLRQLGYYVEFVSNDDPAIFATSGFERRPNARVAPEPLSPARILKIAHGANSGTARITLSPSLRKVRHYEVRYSIQETDATPDSWISVLFTSANGPVSISNLQPGERYAFQTRALGKAGFTDWSDSTMFIST